jgi:putative ABC transport system substrate-binding protein
MSDMRRRDFIARIGGAAAAWPLAARAQQGERMRRIGVLMHTAADEPESQARLAAFMQGLQELGWAVGRNMRIDYRWSVGDAARLRKDAAELVALGPEVILAGVGATTQALQQASRTVPIVMAGPWTRSAMVTSTVSRDLAAISLGSFSSSTPWLGSGRSCSRR